MASIPKTMKAIQISKNGGTEVLEYKSDVPVPEPKQGEVLIKNEFIGINFIDTYFRTGLYPTPYFPYTLGREGSGTIVSVGSSVPSDLKVDTPVVYMSNGSAYAEYTATSAVHVYARSPDSKISSETAAAALLQGLTGISMIEESYKVQKDDWILVPAAAGGMGLWLCQLLKAKGAHTIGTASTAAKRKLAEQHGAEVTLEYPEPGEEGVKKFAAKVKEITGGKGVAAVFDGVGKDTFDSSLACLKLKGSMVSFGNASGAVPPFAIARLSAGNFKVMRPTLMNAITTREEFQTYTKELFEIVEKGNIAVNVHKVYDLKDAAQAQNDIEGRVTTGKLLLKP